MDESERTQRGSREDGLKSDAISSAGSSAHVGEVAALFLRLGFTAFGGPAAHIAMMREEVIHRRKWMSDERFVDLIGIVNLIPGPNSTELAIYLGYLRAGWLGLIAAGACVIGPAMLIVLVLALIAFAVLLRFRPNSAWLIAAGGLVGLAARGL